MYVELGGYPGYQATPTWELLECRLSIIAEINKDNEDAKKQQDETDEAKREADHAKRMAR